MNPLDPGRPAAALVVDTESQSLYRICRALREAGYRTMGTASFTEARRVLVAERPQMLVADVRLGEYNGLQLLMLSREIAPGITVVITNAFPDRVLQEETQRMGGTFMVKPVDVAELLNAARIGSEAAAARNRRKADRRVRFIAHFQPDRRLSERRKA